MNTNSGLHLSKLIVSQKKIVIYLVTLKLCHCLHENDLSLLMCNCVLTLKPKVHLSCLFLLEGRSLMWAECYTVLCERLPLFIEKVVIFNLQNNSSKYVNRERTAELHSLKNYSTLTSSTAGTKTCLMFHHSCAFNSVLNAPPGVINHYIKSLQLNVAKTDFHICRSSIWHPGPL